MSANYQSTSYAGGGVQHVYANDVVMLSLNIGVLRIFLPHGIPWCVPERYVRRKTEA